MTEYIVRMPSDMPYEIKAELNAWYVNSEPIVRCRDCDDFDPRDEECGGRNWCERMSFEVTPDGFCAWGERRESEWLTCKCGEEIELGDRESAVCPSCGRMVRE